MKLQTNNFIDDLERWHKAYQNHMKALSYSPNTIELYSRAIYQFIEYSLQFQEEMMLKDIKSIYIAGYLAYLEDEARLHGKKEKNGLYLSKSTKDTYLKAIKVFFVFISDNNDDFFDYSRYFKNIKVADTSRLEERLIYLTEDEIEKLLNVLDREKAKKDNYNLYRNSLLIKLLLYAGLRISEALHIKLEDFRTGQNSDIYLIEIYGKGGKAQIGYIAKKTIQDELDYFAKVAELESDQLIMRTKSGKEWNRSNAFTVVNSIYRRAGIRKQGLHLLRHTLAMRLTQRGVNPITIKKILRHSNIATTTIYAKATEESVVEAIQI